MKNHEKMLPVVCIVALFLSTSLLTLATESLTTGNVQAENAAKDAANVTEEMQKILQLAQANLNDDTIIAFIKKSEISYSLDANQLIYLRQHGVSDVVIKTMLNQPQATVRYVNPTYGTPTDNQTAQQSSSFVKPDIGNTTDKRQSQKTNAVSTLATPTPKVVYSISC